MTINTTAYEFSHGRKPSTRTIGWWWFEVRFGPNTTPQRFDYRGKLADGLRGIRTLAACKSAAEIVVLP